jgi:hypothetical protein
VSEGKTLDSGIRVVLRSGSEIIAAKTKVEWPGVANVEVCAPTIFAGQWKGERILNGAVVGGIGPDLTAERPFTPARIGTQAALSGTGFLTYGRGFLIPIDTAEAMLVTSARNGNVVFPLLSAGCFTESPTHSPTEYVINFGACSEQEAAEYPEPFAWITTHARAERMASSREDARKYWWRLVGRAEGVYEAADAAGLSNVLANLRVSKHHSFAMISRRVAPEANINIFAFDSFAAFAVLQGSGHELWADKSASTLETRRRYTPTSCFQTFPFPPDWTTDPTLEAVGQTYYDFRAALMVRNNEGLTKTYNRFHDPEEMDPDILELRRLHAAMDRAVLDAYGWTDISTDCVFRLDYEEPEDEDAEETGKKRRKKKPWRLRWPEAVHDEVLARLLALNQERAEEERKMAAPKEKGKKAAAAKGPKAAPKGKAPAPRALGAPSLFGPKDER